MSIEYIPTIPKDPKEAYEAGVKAGVQHTESSPETKIMFADIKGKLDGISNFHVDIKDDLKDIKEQTTKHNGRMKKLEVWRGYITGAISVLILIVLPSAVWSFKQIIETKELLSAIEITVELE